MKTKLFTIAALLLTALNVNAAGQTQKEGIVKYGMEFKGMYIQPVIMSEIEGMDHAKMGHEMPMNMEEMDHAIPEGADIHLELRVVVTEDNPYNFKAGAWMPYLKIDYRIEKEGTKWFTSGSLDPMVANDGPHYGNNVKLNGVGKYSIKYRVTAPNLMLHMDKETAPTAWFKPFVVSWDLTYLGIGKKGGY
ncbi:iron transporter [Thalassotalea aquiviva]|uniref:iron transporter n=1 Tax=Thalassotalea aquiviva TaxID=3242415 RepID=UPI00352B14A5